MELNLTQCIKCEKCWDKDNTIHPYDSNICYSSGLCFTCFIEVAREKQAEKKGEYCFGTDKECLFQRCFYRKKCETMKEQKE